MVASTSAAGEGFSMMLPRASSMGALEASCGPTASSARRDERVDERSVGGATRGVPSARGAGNGFANPLRRDHSMRAPPGEITGLNALLENSKRNRPRDAADSMRGSAASLSHRSPPTLPTQLSGAELSTGLFDPPAESAQPHLLKGLPMS